MAFQDGSRDIVVFIGVGFSKNAKVPIMTN
jgi:hypothetical protein